jgi:hypothetical protein
MRYLIFLALATLVTLSAIAPVRADNASGLKSLTVTFHTRGWDGTGDPKKPDTRVMIAEYTEDGDGIHTFARQNDIAPGMAFDDPSDKGPYEVHIEKPISKSDFLKSKTGLQIIPTGVEKWCVIVEVTATFADGSKVTAKSNMLEMTGATSARHFDNKPEKP